MFAQGLSIRAAREDETVAAVAELCCCPKAAALEGSEKGTVSGHGNGCV